MGKAESAQEAWNTNLANDHWQWLLSPCGLSLKDQHYVSCLGTLCCCSPQAGKVICSGDLEWHRYPSLLPPKLPNSVKWNINRLDSVHLDIAEPAYFLTPFTMTSRHINCHFPKVCNFLSLKPVKVRLDCGTRVLQILSWQVKSSFQLVCKKGQTFRSR